MLNILTAALILTASLAVSCILRPILRRGWSGVEGVTDEEWVMGRQRLVVFTGFLASLLWLWAVSPAAHNWDTAWLFAAFIASGFSLDGMVSGTRHRGAWWLLLVVFGFYAGVLCLLCWRVS
jgi:hypothetical protein